MWFGNSLGDVWKSDIASLLTPLLRATSEARNHPYLQVAITCVRHVCSQHRLTAYPYLFELPLRMNGMRRTQSDHACLDRLGWARCKGRRDRTQATSWFPLAWIQTLLVKGLDNCHLFQISPILCTRGLEFCGKRKNRQCRLFNG